MDLVKNHSSRHLSGFYFIEKLTMISINVAKAIMSIKA